MKWIKPFVSMLVVMLLFCGCKSNENDLTPVDTNNEQVTLPEETPIEDSTTDSSMDDRSSEEISGFFNGSTYVNPWLQLSLEFDEAYYIATEDDVKKLTNKGMTMSNDIVNTADTIDNRVVFAVFEKPLTEGALVNGNYMGIISEGDNREVEPLLKAYEDNYKQLFSEALIATNYKDLRVGVLEGKALELEVNNGLSRVFITHWLFKKEDTIFEITQTMDGNNPLPSINDLVLFD